MSPMHPEGLFVPLVTPFTEGGEVDLASVERLAGEILAAGATGIVALGTTGEPATLDDAEKRAIIEVCARACGGAGGGAPLIVGAGSNNTRSTADSLRALAHWPEISAALVPVPPFTRPSEAGVIAHFAAVAEASPVPVIVYHIPYRTGRTLAAPTLAAIAALPGVIGVKQATGAIDAETVALLAEPPPGFAVLAGDDVFAGALLALGASGAVLASAHLHTTLFAAMISAWRAGDARSGRELGRPLARLAAALFAEPNPTVLKGVLHATGRIATPAVRLPLLPAARGSVAVAGELAQGIRTTCAA
jgi:4-hydroxy-tetrahydrodipicolinate synthase